MHISQHGGYSLGDGACQSFASLFIPDYPSAPAGEFSIRRLYNRGSPVFQTQLCDLLNLVGEGAGWRHRYLSRQSPTVWLRVGSCLTEGASSYRTSRTSSGAAPHRISTFLPFGRLMAALRRAERGDAINLKPKSRRLQGKKEKG